MFFNQFFSMLIKNYVRIFLRQCSTIGQKRGQTEAVVQLMPKYINIYEYILKKKMWWSCWRQDAADIVTFVMLKSSKPVPHFLAEWRRTKELLWWDDTSVWSPKKASLLSRGISYLFVDLDKCSGRISQFFYKPVCLMPHTGAKYEEFDLSFPELSPV